MIRKTLAAIGRFLARFRYLLAWFVSAGALLLIHRSPSTTKVDVTVLAVELVTLALLYAMLEQWRRRTAETGQDELRAELAEEREKTNSLLEQVHQHYLSAIRDHDMTPDSYDRCRALAESARTIAFAKYAQPAADLEATEVLAEEVDLEEVADTARLDREVKASTWAGYGPDGEIER